MSLTVLPVLMPPWNVRPLRRPRADVDQHAVVAAGTVSPKFAGVGDVVAGLAELRRGDVVETADRVAAAARQPRIGRRGDAERREVGRRRPSRLSVTVKLLEPAPEVADLDRDARQQLLLDRRADLPVVRTDAPAVEQRRVDGRGGQRRGAERGRASMAGAFAVGARCS